MIGKIVAIALFTLAFIAYTGINASHYYQDFVIIRDKAQPVVDNMIEKVLQEASNYDLKSATGPLSGGK
ncbi:MAG: hypothetical protein WA833_03430 [Nitrosotalea sp.]